MNKYKKLFSDFALFAISNFGSKILIFLLVPLYTNTLTTYEYGVIDLIFTTIHVILPVITLALSEAVIRFALDKSYKNTEVLLFSLFVNLFSFVILIFSYNLIKIFSTTIIKYWGYFLCIYFLISVELCLSNYVRGIDKTKIFAIKGILYTITFVFLNVFFLLIIKIGLKGYFFSIIISELIIIIYMIISSRKDIIIRGCTINIKLYKDMLKYSIPLIPTIVSWWIMQASDKYIIIYYEGISESGIYGISYKIPTILSMVTSIFIQAWQISAIKSVDDKDNDVFVSSIYRYFTIFSIFSCSCLIIWVKPLGRLLYAKEYFIAWKYVPILLIAYLFSGLSGVLASIFTAKKKTNVLFHSTLFGAITNLILNIIFIPKYGSIAAAYTTMAGFFITWIIRKQSANKLMKINTDILKDIMAFITLLIQAIFISKDFIFKYVFSLIVLIILSIIYNKHIIFLVKLIYRTFIKVSNRKYKK